MTDISRDVTPALVGCCDPGEGFGVGVPVLDVVADLFDQHLHRGEGAPADGLAVMTANPVSIWFIQEEPIGVK